jgi:hypothetical protein
MITYCPVCEESVRANETDGHGRCIDCRGIPNVTVDGVEYAVIAVGIEEMGGEAARGLKNALLRVRLSPKGATSSTTSLKSSTRRRIARGIRKHLRDQGNAVVESFDNFVFRPGGVQENNVFTDWESPPWKSPPCEHHSKKGSK